MQIIKGLSIERVLQNNTQIFIGNPQSFHRREVGAKETECSLRCGIASQHLIIFTAQRAFSGSKT